MLSKCCGKIGRRAPAQRRLWRRRIPQRGDGDDFRWRAVFVRTHRLTLDPIPTVPPPFTTICKPSDCKRNTQRLLKMRCLSSSIASSPSLYFTYPQFPLTISVWNCSAIDTDSTGRIDKASVLHALQSRGESYDRARETLKHVSVDASGKVELEDWVEVRHRFPWAYSLHVSRLTLSNISAQRKASVQHIVDINEGGQGHSSRLKRKRQPYDQRG